MNIDFKIVPTKENEYTHVISQKTALDNQKIRRPVKLARTTHIGKAHPVIGSSLSNF
jgi:CRISPR/Cas system-associated endonuclease Cas3-HD